MKAKRQRIKRVELHKEISFIVKDEKCQGLGIAKGDVLQYKKVYTFKETRKKQGIYIYSHAGTFYCRYIEFKAHEQEALIFNCQNGSPELMKTVPFNELVLIGLVTKCLKIGGLV